MSLLRTSILVLLLCACQPSSPPGPKNPLAPPGTPTPTPQPDRQPAPPPSPRTDAPGFAQTPPSIRT